MRSIDSILLDVLRRELGDYGETVNDQVHLPAGEGAIITRSSLDPTGVGHVYLKGMVDTVFLTRNYE